jgi:hypothetical protein
MLKLGDFSIQNDAANLAGAAATSTEIGGLTRDHGLELAQNLDVSFECGYGICRT